MTATVLSLDELRAKRGMPAPSMLRVNTHLMVVENKSSSYLASTQQNGVDTLVIARPSGQAITIVFADDSLGEHDVLIVSAEHAGKALLHRISDDLLLPRSQEQYDKLWRYVIAQKMEVRGPLFMARAAKEMRDNKVTPEQALEAASRQGSRAIEQLHRDVESLKEMSML